MRARTLAGICLQHPNKTIRIMDPNSNTEYELHGVASNNEHVYLSPVKVKRLSFLARITARLRKSRT